MKWYSFGVERSKVKVTQSISAFFTSTAVVHRHSLDGVTSRLRGIIMLSIDLMTFGMTTAIRRGFELCECLLVLLPLFCTVLCTNTFICIHYTYVFISAVKVNYACWSRLRIYVFVGFFN